MKAHTLALTFSTIAILFSSCCDCDNEKDNKDVEKIIIKKEITKEVTDTTTISDNELKKEVKVIKFSGLTSLDANVNIGAGMLKIGSTEKDQFNAVYAYNENLGKPIIDFTENGEKAELSISQKKFNKKNKKFNKKNKKFNNNYKYIWNLAFNKDLPTNLTVNFGAGDGELNIGDLNILDLNLALGAGDINIDLSNNNSLENIKVAMGIGNVDIDLSNINKVFSGNIDGGIGEMTIALPKDIGVKIKAKKAIGKINTKGLSKKSHTYTNEAFDADKEYISINVNAGIGEINLNVQE